MRTAKCTQQNVYCKMHTAKRILQNAHYKMCTAKDKLSVTAERTLHCKTHYSFHTALNSEHYSHSILLPALI